MKRTIQLAVLALIFISSFSSFTHSQSIPSGTARYEALGFNPFIMDAAIDLNRNPAWGTKYINYAFGDFGRYSRFNGDKDSTYSLRDQYIGFNLRAGRSWALGLVLNKVEGQIFGGAIRSTYEALGNDAPIVPFKALIAYNSSSKLSIGLSPYIAYWNSESTSPNLKVDRSTSVLGATFGIVANMSPSSWTEGTVGVKFNKYKVDSTAGTTNTLFENDGKIELNAFYRGWYKIKNTNVNLVPYINFGLFNWEPTRTPALASTNKFDTWNLLAGIGINIPITENGMFAGGLSGGYNSSSSTSTTFPSESGTGSTIEVKTEGVVFPQFNLGVEWSLTDWLIGRFGYSRSIQDRKLTYSSIDTTVTTIQEIQESVASNSDQTMTIGLGWEFGNFSLDGLIGERFIQIGPNIFSGKENDMFGVISMSYNFKK
ncbi:MAG: hypothetical protein M3R36_15695 [Bacteroidota bacterium]|nr:hypothetical protein [Bacteroidota bacterium]